MVHLRLAVVTFLSASFGCVGCLGGVASARFKGSVAVGDVSQYSFDENANPSKRQPIADARLVFYAAESKTSCLEAAKRWPEPQPSSTTDSDGEFNIKRYYTGVIGGTRTKLLLCVSHPKYKPFEYEAIGGESSEPQHGEKFLNIQLERK